MLVGLLHNPTLNLTLLSGFDPLSHLPKNAEVDVDLFAGGGGASTGFEVAFGKSPDIAINHDVEALAMHQANHPDTIHLSQNVINVEPLWATGGRLVRALWASPDCTHFSKAKGGVPRNQFIRDLAWTVVRWARHTRPKIIGVENVEEFKTWGPLDAEGYPIKERAGETFREWVKALKKLGYSMDWRELSACDYGVPTTRKRLFIVARLDKKKVRWPKPTHGPGTETPYRTAAECIDWNDHAPSIFERKRPLARNTQRRIAEGIRRYVLRAKKPFIVTYYGSKGKNDFRGFGVDEPFRTLTTEHRFGLTVPYLVTPNHGGTDFRGQDLLAPLGTATGKGSFCYTTPLLIAIDHKGSPGSFSPSCHSILNPLTTVTAENRHAYVAACLITNTSGHAPGYLGSPVPTLTSGGQQMLASACLLGAGGPKYSGKPVPANAPFGTILPENHRALTTANLMVKNYSGVIGHDLFRPLGTVTGRDHHSLTTAYMVKMRGTNIGGPVHDPVQTISAQGLHHAVVSASLIAFYSGGGQYADAANPMPTATTRDRFGLQAAYLQQYNGQSEPQPMGEPLGTVTGRDRFACTAVSLCQFNGSSLSRDARAPLPTCCQRDKFGITAAMLAVPSAPGSWTDPAGSCVPMAYSAEHRLHLPASYTEPAGHYEEVRAFLREWGVIGPNEEAEVAIDGVIYRINDIGLRMMRPRELFKANGFPDDYVIAPEVNGKPLTITSQVKKCGNAVPPAFVTAVFRANMDAVTYGRDSIKRSRLPLFESCPDALPEVRAS